MNYGKNIFAIEGEWNERLDSKETIKSSITFLNEVYDIKFILRKVNKLSSLVAYLEQVSRASYKQYGIILLAFHGANDGIEIDSNKTISINKLANECEGLFIDKIVHFSSCSMAKDIIELQEFKRITGAKKVMGYASKVDFLESTLFDIALLQKLNEYHNAGSVNNYMKKNYKSLYKKLDFRMI